MSIVCRPFLCPNLSLIGTHFQTCFLYMSFALSIICRFYLCPYLSLIATYGVRKFESVWLLEIDRDKERICEWWTDRVFDVWRKKVWRCVAIRERVVCLSFADYFCFSCYSLFNMSRFHLNPLNSRLDKSIHLGPICFSFFLLFSHLVSWQRKVIIIIVVIISVTRWWNKRLPNFSQYCPKVARQFFTWKLYFIK